MPRPETGEEVDDVNQRKAGLNLGLETDILELRNVITLAAMAFEEDKNAAAFCIYDARDRAEAVKAKYGELWHKALKRHRQPDDSKRGITQVPRQNLRGRVRRARLLK